MSVGNKKVCTRCGYYEVQGMIHVHHINRDHTDNRPENRVLLCQPCHAGLHAGKWDGLEIGIANPPIKPRVRRKVTKSDIRTIEYSLDQIKQSTVKDIIDIKQSLNEIVQNKQNVIDNIKQNIADITIQEFNEASQYELLKKNWSTQQIIRYDSAAFIEKDIERLEYLAFNGILEEDILKEDRECVNRVHQYAKLTEGYYQSPYARRVGDVFLIWFINGQLKTRV